MIKRKEIKSMVANMLHNLRHILYSHNSNITYIGSTTKCIGFESIYYVVNLDVISSFMIFSDLDYMFLSMYY